MIRECISTGAAGAQTRRYLRHHLLHPQVLRLLLLLKTTDFEAQSFYRTDCTRRSKFLTHALYKYCVRFWMAKRRRGNVVPNCAFCRCTFTQLDRPWIGFPPLTPSHLRCPVFSSIPFGELSRSPTHRVARPQPMNMELINDVWSLGGQHPVNSR